MLKLMTWSTSGAYSTAIGVRDDLKVELARVQASLAPFFEQSFEGKLLACGPHLDDHGIKHQAEV